MEVRKGFLCCGGAVDKAASPYLLEVQIEPAYIDPVDMKTVRSRILGVVLINPQDQTHHSFSQQRAWFKSTPDDQRALGEKIDAFMVHHAAGVPVGEAIIDSQEICYNGCNISNDRITWLSVGGEVRALVYLTRTEFNWILGLFFDATK